METGSGVASAAAAPIPAAWRALEPLRPVGGPVVMLTILMAWMATAQAEVPGVVRPVVAPADVLAQHRAKVPDGPPLACDVLWKGYAMLCFRVWEGKKRRWVTTADLEAWQATVADLRGAVRAMAPSHLDLQRQEVGGMAASWWLLADGDGWAAAGGLVPERIAAKVGLPLRVAIPAEGVMVAWKAGGPELDQVMLVGVRELFDGQPGAVTPMAHTWDGDGWTPFARAVPAEAGAP